MAEAEKNGTELEQQIGQERTKAEQIKSGQSIATKWNGTGMEWSGMEQTRFLEGVASLATS